MAPGRIRMALGAVKDQTTIGLAKVSSSSALSELEVAIVKATRHDERPAEEKHAREILSLTSYSRANIAACVALLSRRLGRTRSWAVALKALVLIHRLLADGDPAYEQEVFFATRRGTRMLNMADFRGVRRWDFSAFVRTYAMYLDERLEYKMMGRRYRVGGMLYEGEELDGVQTPARLTPVKDMKLDRLLAKAHHLQMLLDRLIACRPTGGAKDSRIVAMALYLTVKESFQIYLDLAEITASFVDRFTALSVPDSVRVHELFSKLSKQLEELESFHSWSLTACIARTSDYPEIQHISQSKLQLMQDFIHNRQLPSNKPFAIFVIDEVRDLLAMQAGESPENVVEDGKQPVIEPVLLTVTEEKATQFFDIQSDSTINEQPYDSLPLVLFDSSVADAGAPPQWECFHETADWEKTLARGMLMLEGMHPQCWTEPTIAARASDNNTSVAMLSLPALESDPFAASSVIAPPAWVQMSDMETRRRLFADEQQMWRQHARDGRHGRLPRSGGGVSPYN